MLKIVQRREGGSRENENHSRKTIDERESPNITNTQHQRPHTQVDLKVPHTHNGRDWGTAFNTQLHTTPCYK